MILTHEYCFIFMYQFYLKAVGKVPPWILKPFMLVNLQLQNISEALVAAVYDVLPQFTELWYFLVGWM